MQVSPDLRETQRNPFRRQVVPYRRTRAPGSKTVSLMQRTRAGPVLPIPIDNPQSNSHDRGFGGGLLRPLMMSQRRNGGESLKVA